MSIRTAAALLAASLVLAIGCKSGDKDSKKDPTDQAPKTSGNDTRDPASAGGDEQAPPTLGDEIAPGDIVWEKTTMETVGLELASIAGSELKQGELRGSRYVRGFAGQLQYAVWAGEGRTLEVWRAPLERRKGVTLSEVETVEICGAEGQKQTAVLPALQASNIKMVPLADGKLPTDELSDRGDTPRPPPAPEVLPEDKDPRRTPERAVVVIAFTYGETPVIASWGLPTADREAFAEHEKAFFDSLTCP